jgi:hypothetical protein
VIRRFDKIAADRPRPKHASPNAAAVQELLGGKFGEMSTSMHYSAAPGREIRASEMPEDPTGRARRWATCSCAAACTSWPTPRRWRSCRG